jgi:trehalose 6-phosphate synthase
MEVRVVTSGNQLVSDPVTVARSEDDRPLIFVSNRGPIEHFVGADGQIESRRSGGGVAVALSAALCGRKVTWIAGASNPADRAIAESRQSLWLDGNCKLTLVPIADEVAQPFYSSFCNPILWFIQHGLADQLTSDDLEAEARESWLAGYLPVNRLFADAVISDIDRHGHGARVMLHDYHLYVAASLIRRARPNAHLQQFVHIPWPAPSAWKLLPSWLVREMFRGLLANDSVVFQTEESAVNFVATCETYMPGEFRASASSARISYRGRSVHVWSNPISVDPWELSSLTASEEVERLRTALAKVAAEKVIVRVDRLDPSKNILRGFRAFELLLSRRPDLYGRVKFLAFLVPSRSGIPEYDSHARAVFSLIELINLRYGTPDWTPITVFHEHNRPQAIAGLGLYDVLLVNSVADGMNLVSKEGPLVNKKDGVVCLSTGAGSYEQLRAGVIGVDPLDVRQTAQALEVALELGPEVRGSMATMTKSAIEGHQLSDWLRHLMQDLELAAWRRAEQLAPA